MVVFGQSGLFMGKSGCIPARWLYLGKSGCILVRCLLSCKVVVFGQSGCNRANWLCSGSDCIRAKWL